MKIASWRLPLVANYKFIPEIASCSPSPKYSSSSGAPLSEKVYHGFTLVEFLVVLVIISLLAAMLLPALIAARDKARVISCMSQEHQMYLAFQGYASDFGRYLPGGTHTFNGRAWLTYQDLRWVGLGRLYRGGYLSRQLLLDPGWRNQPPYVDFLASENFAKGYTVDWSSIEPKPDDCDSPRGYRRTGTYAYLSHDKPTNLATSFRRLGRPPAQSHALVACCNGEYLSTRVGAHNKNRLNVLYEGGRVRTFDNIRRYLWVTHDSSSGGFWEWARDMDKK